MPNFEYESLNEHLNDMGIFYRLVADQILRIAQENALDGEIFEIDPDDLPDGFDFLRDRELIVCMLAEQPEVADVEAHNNGFNIRLQEHMQEITENRICIRDELLIESNHINAYLETWFDISRRLGLPALGEDDSGNMYADYYPRDDRLEVHCIIKYADGTSSEAIELDITDSERDVILQCMRGAGLDDCIAEIGIKPTQADLEAMAELHYNFLNILPGGKCADFSGMLLHGLEMRSMNLCGANFSGAVLRECDMGHGSFDNCDFSGTIFHAVQAGDASFEQSNFAGAQFESCNFYYAYFECADFTNAAFDDTNLHRATMDGCNFHGAQFENTDPSEATTFLAKGIDGMTSGSAMTM